jgi:hypothetical protein
MTFRPLATALVLLGVTLATPAGAQTARDSVLSAIDGFLEGMRAKDSTQMRQFVDPVARMTLLRPAAGGGVRVMLLSADDFLRVATAPDQAPLDEPIRNPVVQIDGDLASVWAEYQVRRDGRVTHCGYDAFHLVRQQGRWRILNVSDTYRTTGCGPIWPT